MPPALQQPCRCTTGHQLDRLNPRAPITRHKPSSGPARSSSHATSLTAVGAEWEARERDCGGRAFSNERVSVQWSREQ
eukprot:scaffold201055_cov29-Tisochrysis_lutea.AAC.21